jgi:transcriptional regulator with XRE-family HTH domain
MTSHHISGKFLCVENLTSQIGLQIRTARKSKGMTQREVSQKPAWTRPYISRLENGTAEGSPAQMLSIARAIGVSIAQLYDEQDDTAKKVAEQAPISVSSLQSFVSFISREPRLVEPDLVLTYFRQYSH